MACYVSSPGDLANLSRASKTLRQAANPLLEQVKSFIRRGGEVASSTEPLANAMGLLDLIGKLPSGLRFLPLKALAAQVPKLLNDVADQVAGRIMQAASGLAPHEQDALQAAIRGPDNGLHGGFVQTGFF